MNCVIVDDEYRGRELLATLLKTHCPELTVAAMADSVSGACEVIRMVEPEIVFLDIEMHDGTGFDLLQKFDIPYFKTIFVTSYDQYAIQAVRFHAYDYLLKPVIINELKDAVKRLVEENKLSPGTPSKHPMLEINHKTKLDYVKLDDLLLLQGDGNYTYIYTVQEGKTYHTSRVLKEYEEILCVPGSGFCRVHKSSIINLRYVKNFHHSAKSALLLTNGQFVEVSRRKKEEVLAQLKEFRSVGL